MARIYTYPKNVFLSLLILILVIFLFFVLIKGFLFEFIGSKAILNLIILLILSFSAVYAVGGIIANILSVRKIIVGDNTIQIKNIFKTITIRWNDIIEFGRYKEGFGVVWYWSLYFKTKETDKKIIICTHTLKNLNDFIDTIFETIPHINFITLLNTSRLPFIKNIEAIPWDKSDKVFD